MKEGVSGREMDRYVRELAESDEEIHFQETRIRACDNEPNLCVMLQLEKFAPEEAGYTFQHLYSGADMILEAKKLVYSNT